MHRLGDKMENLVDTRANEMEPVLPELIVDELELTAPRAKKDVSVLEVLLVDSVLRHDLNTTHELAKVDPIALRKDGVQKRRSKTKYVKVEFPSFVVGIDFVSDVAWFTIERAGNEHASVLNSFPVHCPSVFIMQDCPIPQVFVVCVTAFHHAVPE